MKYKLNSMTLIVATLSLLFSNLYAQELPCGTTVSDDDLTSMRLDSSTQLNTTVATSGIQYFAVQHHIVRKSNGTGGLNISAPDILIESLNSNYEDTNIRFYSCGTVDEIHSDTYYEFVKNTSEASLMSTYNQSNAINVYYMNSIYYSTEIGYVGGYASFPWDSRKIITINHNNPISSTGTHEFGHFFGLLHTFETANGKELVNRDPNNCKVYGDGFCDTPADLKPSTPGVTLSGCDYTGTLTDTNGDLYAPDIHNHMSYYPCRSHFSSDQIDKMNDWAGKPQRQGFIHTTTLNNMTITTNNSFSGGIVIINDMTIQNNADVVFENCGPVVIEKDFEITIGATLEIH
jgi:hypothetical protein